MREVLSEKRKTAYDLTGVTACHQVARVNLEETFLQTVDDYVLRFVK